VIDNQHDLVGAFVLDALSPDERLSFERHLATCQACRAEVVELRAVTNLLPLAVDPIEPSAGLRARIMAGARAEPLPNQARPQLRVVRGRLARRTLAPILGLAAAIAIAALGVWNFQLRHDLDHLRSTSAFQQQVDAQLARGATVTRIAGSGPDASAVAALVQPRHGAGYLIVDGLRSNPSNRVYQVWLMRGTKPRSVGVFNYGQSQPAIVPLSTPSFGFTVAAVTLEPGPLGSRLPTGPKVLVGRLSA